MKIKALLFTLLLLIFTAVVGCSNENNTTDNETQDEKLKIYTTIFPLEDFTKKIGGEYVDVHSIYPPGADAHTYEPSTRVVSEIALADLFIYTGVGAEGFADKLEDVLANEKVKIIAAGKDIDLLADYHEHAHEEDHDHAHEEDEHAHEEDHDHAHEEDEHAHEEDHDHAHEEDEHTHEDEHDHAHGDDEHAHEEDHDHAHEEDEHAHEEDDHSHEDGHDHNHPDGDPHVWIDPILSMQLAENIKVALTEIMPEAADYFEENYNNLIQDLDVLHHEFEDMVNAAPTNHILVSHAAYGYWENRYGLNQISVTGLSPTQEPSQRQLTEIIKTAQENNIKYVIFDQNITGKIAEMVKTEIKAEALTLHNLESLTEEDRANEEDYFSLMRKNIETLRTALNK